VQAKCAILLPDTAVVQMFDAIKADRVSRQDQAVNKRKAGLLAVFIY